MSPVTEFTPEGRPEFFARGIPAGGIIPIQSSEPGREPETVITNPRIYYGENTVQHTIVNTNTDELDYQTAEGELFRTKYTGVGGVQLSSLLRRIAFAWQLTDLNVLISGEITGESRIQYRREIQERVRSVAPFLLLDEDPYMVAADGRLVWMQDAYTYTDSYPYSDPSDGDINYVRNSVKVTIDAFDGTVKLYIADPTDPMVRTYEKIFPGLFLPLEEMPATLLAHIRYPLDPFSLQVEKYAKYHMRDPQNLYNNEDLWEIPNEKFGQSDVLQPIEPYYVIMRLPGEEREEFVLLLPYTPNQRKNIVGWLAARSDGENYGKLVAFSFPKDRQVDGPEQIEARIDNDPEISAWFTLRCQEGSFCIRGNLLVIPVGESLLFVEPVYIQAEGVEFPELKRVILATGERVVMAGSLSEALTLLVGDTGSRVAVPVDREEVEPGEQAPPGIGIAAEVDRLSEALGGLKGNITEIEEALERLTELLGQSSTGE